MSCGKRRGGLALGSWAVLALLWLFDVGGSPLPAWVPRGLALATFLLTAWWITGLRRYLAAEHRPRVPLALALVALGLAAGFAGLGHEVGKGYYTDEGHYLHHAREVNSGKPFSRSFIYPHLTYYLDAFALWLAGLFPAAVAAASRAVYGVGDPEAVQWLVLRCVTAGLGVATVVPVFVLARRVAGDLAAILAGGLVIFSIHYQGGFQVNISDVPSAFFATVCLMFVGRLLDEERPRDYVLAGVAAGLAAAAKYPAGFVAVAIVAIWTVHRIRRRDFRAGLIWAGGAALAAFLAANPSLFVHPDAAIHGPRGFLFGVRQYAKGGWVGVMPQSNTLYYLGKLLESFRWPALGLAAAGAFFLDARARRRLLLLAPFPLAYLLLICSMNMVVLRNLFPVIPALAVFLGAAASGLGRLMAMSRPRGGLWAIVALVLAALVWPAAATLRQTVSLTRPSTRDLMSAWVRQNLPPGTGILKGSYTPNFSPDEYRTLERRFAFRSPQERFADPRFDYLLVAGSAFWRWFREENAGKPHGDWYARVFASYPLVHRLEPGPWRRGPELRLYRLPRTAEGEDNG